MSTPSLPATGQSRYPGRRYAWLGIAIAVLGVGGYVFQLMVLKWTFTPWYVPIMVTVGAGLLVWSVWFRRTVWRIVGLLLIGLLAAFEWYFLVYFSRLPRYEGPVAVGKPFPAFRTKLADGTPFTQQRFQGDKDTVLVFFRGRW
jgi:hypothetical protein